MSAPNVSELLSKLNRLLQGQQLSSLSAIEKDLARAYLRQLYEAMMEDEVVVKTETKTVAPPVVEEPKHEEPPSLKFNLQMQESDLPEVPAKDEPLVVQEVFEVQKEKEEAVAAEQSSTTTELNQRFASQHTSINELNQQSNSGINRVASGRDLKEYIDLNRRILFVSELFGGSFEKYMEAIHAINSCAEFEQADALLQNETAVAHRWEMKGQAARLFIKLVKQKFGVE